jgi:hypothetical protein
MRRFSSLRGPYVLRDCNVGAKVSVSDLTATTLSANEMTNMDVSRILISSYLALNVQHPCPVGVFKLLLAIFVHRLCAQLLATVDLISRDIGLGLEWITTATVACDERCLCAQYQLNGPQGA